MSYSDLLDRMKNRDTEAFLEMTDRYGWAVYSAIREKHADHDEADRIYQETMNGFYHSLLNPAAEDPLEALLCTFADQISDKIPDSLPPEREKENQPPKIRLYDEPQPVSASAGKKHGFWYGLGILLVLVAIAAVLWCMAGLLMDMQVIPYCDLGYSWFHTNVMERF